MRWRRTDKADPRCRRLADRHYSRQTVGAALFTRPGYNLVLFYGDGRGGAVFCWWRPIFSLEVGRGDGLLAVECTIFRNESAALSSELVTEAVAALQVWERWDSAYRVITSVNPEATKHRRSKHSEPGRCFRAAGFEPFEHAPGRAGLWLELKTLPPPAEAQFERRGQLTLAV